MLTAHELKGFLQAHGVRLTKRLGQHHLVDGQVIERLAAQWRLSGADTVVEIGAGLGALTEPLAARAGRVIAVERDARMCGLLRERLRRAGNVSVVCSDILQFDWASAPGSVVVGAIPYQITGPLLARLCEARRLIREVWLIIQREVAQRLIARAGTKAYGRLSVLVQYCWQPEVVLEISRGAFFPPPRVDSSCVRLARRAAPPVAVEDEPAFFALVKAAFGQRRKTLVNCLAPGRTPRRVQLEALLARMGLPPAIRGEALSLDQFAALANGLGSG